MTRSVSEAYALDGSSADFCLRLNICLFIVYICFVFVEFFLNMDVPVKLKVFFGVLLAMVITSSVTTGVLMNTMVRYVFRLTL